jgi:hypothetical protein
MASSGTYAFNPPISELALDAYERCGKPGIVLTTQFVQSARRSFNFVLSSWANRGINLWTVDEAVQYMPQGVAQYFDDAATIDVLPDSVTLRQYQMGEPESATPAFTTTSGSAVVTVANLPEAPVAGGYISVVVSVSVGGIVLQGFYQVVSVPGAGQAIITAASPATATVAAGGVVPSFSTAAGSAGVVVALPNHGLAAGKTFTVQIPTSVGGITLLGQYPVAAVIDANSFRITAANVAGSTATASENSGLALLATQAVIPGLTQNASPVDLMLFPLSRGDYMAIPDKAQQGRPTSFWVDRQIVPVFNMWLVPDGNGPYELRYRRSRQVQDADMTGGQTLNVPYRFLSAFTSDLAAALAVKWAPERMKDLATLAAQEWQMAADEDRERTSTFLTPDLSSYFTGD